MIEKGADVNEEEKTGRTPLFSAAYYGPLNLVQTLVAQGADINHADRSGYTPLHSAAAGFQKDIAAYLIEQGAAPDARNSKGVTPLEYARNYSASRPGSVERKQATVRYLETCDVR
jgi:ankyrin repeat protein